MDKKKPYLIKAIYDWCSNENTTPFLSVRLMGKSIVPMQFINEAELTLNISASATKDLSFNKNDISFKARFNGVEEHLSIAYNEITAIFSKEDGDGLLFEILENNEDFKENLNKNSHLKLIK
jgi:stringent starvation protein B